MIDTLLLLSYKDCENEEEMQKQLYLDLVSFKHCNLKRAYLALLAGFVPLVVNVVYYLRLLDGPG
jgi:hypothetical protein